ncbi:hypothetical protein HMPREF3212_02123 [Citrobacter freundii]|nr:hypothetical protein HMPREF3212_02123 [Citrobacter freundii]
MSYPFSSLFFFVLPIFSIPLGVMPFPTKFPFVHCFRKLPIYLLIKHSFCRFCRLIAREMCKR